MIVVTTPTGQTGRQIVDSLLAQGEQVRVIVRDSTRLAESVRKRVQVVEGSHGDAAVVDEAFAGADAVFWLVPADNRASSVHAAYVDFSRPAVDAFVRQGVSRVVGVSALGRGVVDNAGYVSGSLAMDDLIAASGVHFRALTMPSFMDNMLRQVASIREQGVFYSTMLPDLKVPMCANRDIAAMATKYLLDESWTGVGHVAVLGPEDLSDNDQARIVSEVLDRPIRAVQVPMDPFRSQLLDRGMSEAMAQGMVDMMVAKNAGLDNAEPRTGEATTPTTFRQWCQEVLAPAVAG